jgi:hypothetical protein
VKEEVNLTVGGAAVQVRYAPPFIFPTPNKPDSYIQLNEKDMQIYPFTGDARLRAVLPGFSIQLFYAKLLQ